MEELSRHQVLGPVETVYGKYQHLDKLLSSFGDDDEFTLHMLREFWRAIKAEVENKVTEQREISK